LGPLTARLEVVLEMKESRVEVGGDCIIPRRAVNFLFFERLVFVRYLKKQKKRMVQYKKDLLREFFICVFVEFQQPSKKKKKGPIQFRQR
jgi:hypothetical protein